MFDQLTKKFTNLFSSLSGSKELTEDNIAPAVREVRLALLDADVNYAVASNFVKKVKEKIVGEKAHAGLKPQQQFIKVIHEELIALMGSKEAPLQVRSSPSVILLCGLQGSGKTTQCAKIAAYLLKKDAKKKILLAACDLQRPAAVAQLEKLAGQAGVNFFSLPGESDPVVVAREALSAAKKQQYDYLILDTAGRMHVAEDLMQELCKIKELTNPCEVLFVANSSTGQDAVKTAEEFNQKIGITGSILTMLDGTARAGSALSIAEITKKPIKFEGIGERIQDFQLFNPHSMADRILGMGDMINLMRKAQEQFDTEEEKKLEKKMRKGSLTYEDYLKQMGMIKKMGSIKSLLKMIPGLSGLSELELSDKEFKKLEAMILSMTPAERKELVELDPSRRRRIAQGSGVSIDDVNRMVKSFKRLKQLLKDMPHLQRDAKNMMGKKENFLWR